MGGKEVGTFIQDVRAEPNDGEPRARVLEDLFLQPCFHLCGVCNETGNSYGPNGTGEQECSDISDLYQLAANTEAAIHSAEQLKNPQFAITTLGNSIIRRG